MNKGANNKKNDKVIEKKDDKKSKGNQKEEKAAGNKKSQPVAEPTKKAKRGRNAYLFFSLENRDRVKKDNPGVKPKDILSIMGKLWNALSEVEKKKFFEMAEKDKERVAKEMENVVKVDNKKRKQSASKTEKNGNKKSKKMKSEEESEGSESD